MIEGASQSSASPESCEDHMDQMPLSAALFFQRQYYM